ncbi:MAG TPA: transcription antitermination factor NusB, partial [Trebonia sp.]|nr:transcription antitermination factor NusB [Trebonia sp.]
MSAAGKGAPTGRGGSRRPRGRRPADPRRAAYDVLAAVRDRAAYANLLLPKLLGERGLAGRDAALATELAYGTLRGQGSYDAVL